MKIGVPVFGYQHFTALERHVAQHGYFSANLGDNMQSIAVRLLLQRLGVQAGDIVFCELSAYWWDYPGQILRTFTVDADPTPRYADLHATAEATFDAVTGVLRHGAAMQDIMDATGLIEQRGYTVCDDLVHGFGGGYFQPIIGTRSRMAGRALPQMTLEENMTVVVQPNPVTTEADESQRAGVQVGELVRITRNGCERLHRVPCGLFRAGQAI